MKTLQELGKILLQQIKYRNESIEMGLLKLEAVVIRELTIGHLLVLYWRMNNMQKERQLLEKRKQLKVIH